MLTLMEIFGEDQKNYLAGIAFETIKYDDDLNSQVIKKGWVIPYEDMDLYEIDSYATKFNIAPQTNKDTRARWESEEPFKDFMTSDETYYILFVKNLDGSQISEEEKDRINLQLMEVDDGWGFTIDPVPSNVY